MLYEYRWKNFNRLPTSQIQQHIKRLYTMTKKDLSLECKDSSVGYEKSVNGIHHIERMKGEKHMIISMDAEKAFDNIQLS